MYVLPIEIQGALRIFTNEYIGPVPALETFRIDFPNISSADFFTIVTKGSDGFVLAAASP